MQCLNQKAIDCTKFLSNKKDSYQLLRNSLLLLLLKILLALVFR